MKKLEIIKIVEEEIRNPILGTTEQILESHQVFYQDDIPVIVRVDEIREPGSFFIYLRLENHPYYWVLALRKENGKFAPSASYIEAKVRIYGIAGLRDDFTIFTTKQIN